VGIAGFDRGGLLVDGGPGPDGGPAPLLSRIEPPAGWRVLLALDPGRAGLSGSDEKTAIARLPRFSRERAAEICHEVLMRVLAGAASNDFEAFAAGLSRVQRLVGQHFAPAQGGSGLTGASQAKFTAQSAAHLSTRSGPVGSGGSKTGAPARFSDCAASTTRTGAAGSSGGE